MFFFSFCLPYIIYMYKMNIMNVSGEFHWIALWYSQSQGLVVHHLFIDVYYIAIQLYGSSGLSFIVMGFILLVAIIGVIVIGVKKSLKVKRQNISDQFFRYRY